MSDHHTSDESQFAADVDTLVEMLRTEGRPTPEQLEAAGRVARHTIVSIGSIAQSLRRIADAQERKPSAEGQVVRGPGSSFVGVVSHEGR